MKAMIAERVGDLRVTMISLCFNLVLAVVVVPHVLGEVTRPKGVPISMMSHYDPNRLFKCLDGSGVIDFENVNDDYCDCRDGSDEPGTSACTNGHFYCENKGHKSEFIPSSRVGDTICDCCDGSDEWASVVQCEDTCFEKGRAAREEAEKKRLLMAEGYKIREQYMKEGQEARTEKQTKLSSLEQEKGGAEAKKNEMEALKNSAESLEKEAKDKHQTLWDALKKEQQEAKDAEDAEKAFVELDTDADHKLTHSEMQTHLEFDADTSGDVSVDEAKLYLEADDPVDFASFKEDVWPKIRQIYQFSTPPPPVETPPTEAPPVGEATSPEDLDLGEGPDDEDYEQEDDEEEEEEGDDSEEKVEQEPAKEGDEQMPEYDDEAKQLIEAADKARADFTEAEGTFKKIDSEVDELNRFLQLDLGPNDSFYPLKGQCFEYTDREYTYRICPYDRAVQKPKNGGSETHLGTWSRFEGPAEDKYSIMKFDHGTKCWNGPDRSATVLVHCGVENSLTSASEPNRCEYQFDFSTPAVCDQSLAETPHDEHDEL